MKTESPKNAFPFYANFFAIKGKVSELTTTTGMGLEADTTLEDAETFIVEEIEKILSGMKEITSNKKVIFFGEIEDATWLVAGQRFKTSPKISLKRMKFTAADMKWLNKTRNSFDEMDSLTADPKHLVYIFDVLKEA